AGGRPENIPTLLGAFSASAASATVKGLALLGGLSPLERLAIRPPAEVLRRSLLKRFLGHCVALALDWNDWPTLDGLLVDFFNGLFLEWLGPDVGGGAFAAPAHFLSGPGRSGATALPRASRAALGGRRRAPPFARLPAPRAAMDAVVGQLIHRGFPRSALLTAVARACCLRPREMMQVRACHHVTPAEMAGPACQCWPILLHDSARLLAGKTGVHDDAVAIDLDSWLCPALASVRATLRPDGIVDMSFVEPRQAFIDAAVALGLGPLGPHPYQLRQGGGASEDLTLACRSAEQVRLRGGWATFASVKRCAKDARLVDALNSIAPEVSAYDNLALNYLPELLRSGGGLPPGAQPQAVAALSHGRPVPPPARAEPLRDASR
ncbi:unnamed protein product, partial [Prorocentrum cordatum]